MSEEKNKSSINIVETADDTIRIDQALEMAGLGFYQFYSLLILGSILLSVAFIQNYLALFLLKIVCIYKPTVSQLEIDNDVALVGLVSLVIVTMFGDMFSRKKALAALTLISSVNCFMFSACNSWTCFQIGRAIFAFTNMGIYPLIMAMISDSQHSLLRQSLLASLYLFWILGLLLAYVLSNSHVWLYGFGAVFLLLTAFLFQLPDTPLYTFDKQQLNRTLKTLKQMYKYNRWQPEAQYPVHALQTAEATTHKTNNWPHIHCLLVLMLSQLVMSFCFHSVMIWEKNVMLWTEPFYPLDRHNKYNKPPPDCPLIEDGDFRKNLNTYGQYKDSVLLKDQIESTCAENILTDSRIAFTGVFFAAIYTAVVVVILIYDVYGKRFYIAFSNSMSGFLICLSWHIRYQENNLTFTTVYQAMCLMSLVSTYCLMIEIFPRDKRVLGLSLIIGTNFSGAYMGSYGLSLALTSSCVAMTIYFIVLTCGSGLLVLTIPHEQQLIKNSFNAE